LLVLLVEVFLTQLLATIVVPNEFFDANKTLEAVEQEKCTSLYGYILK
jgi:hypothetical protein